MRQLKVLMCLAVALPLVAQQVAPRQIQPGSNGQAIVTQGGIAQWGTATAAPPSGNQLQVLGVPAGGGTGVPVSSLTLTNQFLPVIGDGIKLPTISGGLGNYQVPEDNGGSHAWQASPIAAPPASASPATLNSVIGANSLTQITGSALVRQPFTNGSGGVTDVHDPYAPVHLTSLAELGAVCNASDGNAVTVTSGSNQVVITNVGGDGHNPEPGESMSIVGMLGSGEQVAWEPIIVAYNAGTSTITTYDNAPFSGTGLEMIHGFDDTAELQGPFNGSNVGFTIPGGDPGGYGGGCLDHRLYMGADMTLEGTDPTAASVLVTFPGEDGLDTFDKGRDSGFENGTQNVHLLNFNIKLDTRIDARKQWEQVVTYPASCNATFTACTVTTNQVAPVNRYIGRGSVHANNPLGSGWCTWGSGACHNSIGSVTNGSPTVTIASPYMVPSVGATVVFPYLTPAFQTTVTGESGGTITLAANYPGATNAQTEFFIGSSFQTLAAAITSSATSLTVTLPIQPAFGYLSNFGSDGAFLIDGEIIGYHLVDNANQTVKNLVRGEFGTTPASHAAGALMVPLNPFRPTVPYPVNVAYQSAATPAGAEYYPAFAVGNVGLGFVEQSGADGSASPSDGLMQGISIEGTAGPSLEAAYANGSIGFLDQLTPYNMRYSDITVQGLYWGIAEALPIDNATVANTLPDTSSMWSHIYTFNDLFNQWYQLGGSFSRHDGLEAHLGGGQNGWGDLIETNCEQYDANTHPGSGPYQGQFTSVSGQWSSLYGEALNGDAGTNQSNYEPEQWCQTAGGTVDGDDSYYNFQTFIDANALRSTGGLFGNTLTTAYPTVIYGTNNTFLNALGDAPTPRTATAFGQNAQIVNFGSNNVFVGASGNTAAFSGMGTPYNQNYPSADFLTTGNTANPYVNSNSAVFLPADFSAPEFDAGSFAIYTADPTALYGQSVGCVNPTIGCETNFEPADYQIENGNRVAPITYTGYIQYKASAGTPTANVNVCVSTSPPVNNSCTTVVSTKAVTFSTSWQTLELDNVNLASYAGDWIGMSLTSPSDSTKTYYIGGFELMPLPTRYMAQGFRDTGLVSQPTIGTDANGNLVAGTGGGISGLTTGYIPKATSATSLGNSLLDDGVTTPNTLTYAGTGGVAAPSLAATGAGSGVLTAAEGAARAGAAGEDVLWADSTAHRFAFDANNAGPIDFVGIAAAAAAGDCAKFAANGIDVMDAGAACASGSSLPSGTLGQMLYYAAAGTTVTPTSDLIDSPSTYTLNIMPETVAAGAINLGDSGSTGNANGTISTSWCNTNAADSGLRVESQFSSILFAAGCNSSVGNFIHMLAPSQFNGISHVVDYTFPVELGNASAGNSYAVTGQTTSVSTATLVSTGNMIPTTGTYQIDCVLTPSAVTSTPSVTLTYGWTDEVGTKTYTTASFTLAVGTYVDIPPINVHAKNTAAITVATTLTGAATYDLACPVTMVGAQ